MDMQFVTQHVVLSNCRFRNVYELQEKFVTFNISLVLCFTLLIYVTCEKLRTIYCLL
jgi:hypothetical protein